MAVSAGEHDDHRGEALRLLQQQRASILADLMSARVQAVGAEVAGDTELQAGLADAIEDHLARVRAVEKEIAELEERTNGAE